METSYLNSEYRCVQVSIIAQRWKQRRSSKA